MVKRALVISIIVNVIFSFVFFWQLSGYRELKIKLTKTSNILREQNKNLDIVNGELEKASNQLQVVRRATTETINELNGTIIQLNKQINEAKEADRRLRKVRDRLRKEAETFSGNYNGISKDFENLRKAINEL